MPSEVPGSFRDRAGYVFIENGILKRRITAHGADDYRTCVDSGFHDEAIGAGLLVSHVLESDGPDGITLVPTSVPFISYPYEWTFSQLKDAAVLTLSLQDMALEHGLALKDASAYNIQFIGSKPIFIDTPSFEKYREGQPWIAYRQFCEHFLSPLLLMAKVDPRLSRLQRTFLDGIPIEIAAKVAPRWVGPWLSMHVKMHARAKTRGKSQAQSRTAKMSKNALLGLVRSLRQAVESLRPSTAASEWSDYSSASSYDDFAAVHKHELVNAYCDLVAPTARLVWDLGANAGEFSRIFSNRQIRTVAWDYDASAVEQNYCKAAEDNDAYLLPLVLDLTNPSPALGWAHEERMSFLQRGPADVVMALALIHHLVIGNSVPCEKVAAFFASAGKWLILEYVDNEDSRVVQLRSTRTSAHPYDEETFRLAFAERFDVIRRDPIRDSRRVLYLMRRKDR
jgi:hypothetical protein